ncbi:hypothetical protein J2W40_001596 [Sphingobium xenophagum]|uniref:Uncharacterized protein n=1 Tax=Sphingobium xenophagum TaxID=121428 RepID=A0ABU1WZM5_SPHXE|nr:hypothetical protein [Sphingobium xenophagum]MDR7154781.1 hypothetical protein [Sphingobium xenophagum]
MQLPICPFLIADMAGPSQTESQKKAQWRYFQESSHGSADDEDHTLEIFGLLNGPS